VVASSKHAGLLFKGRTCCPAGLGRLENLTGDYQNAIQTANSLDALQVGARVHGTVCTVRMLHARRSSAKTAGALRAAWLDTAG
jgi:hypothetical protein